MENYRIGKPTSFESASEEYTQFNHDWASEKKDSCM